MFVMIVVLWCGVHHLPLYQMEKKAGIRVLDFNISCIVISCMGRRICQFQDRKLTVGE